MNIFSLFSGIGAFEKALDNLGIPYKLVGFSEIDKYASKSYCAIHGVDESMNFGDITQIDETELPTDIDLITYGFPCQDISLAGKQKGLFNTDGSLTRSGLFFDALRIIEATKPRVAIAENVKNLTGKKFKEQFEIVLNSLEEAGYNNYWKVLNAKDYGIPQNRERVFIVSIRKDIDTGLFQFPDGFPLELRLKDMLEDEVDEKYYLKSETSKKLISLISEKYDISNREVVDGTINDPKVCEVSNCIKARYDCGVTNYKSDGTMIIEPVLIGGMQKNQAIKTDGISTTLTSSMGTGGGYVPMIAASRTRNNQQRLEINNRGVSNSLTTVQKDNLVVEPTDRLIQVGQMYGTEKEPNPQAGRIYSADGISPTMDSCSGGNRMPKVLVREHE